MTSKSTENKTAQKEDCRARLQIEWQVCRTTYEKDRQVTRLLGKNWKSDTIAIEEL